MIKSDDVAIKYEAIIRECYGCGRYKHNSDADLFRKLQISYFDSIQSGDWTEYTKYLNKVLIGKHK